MTLAAWEPQNVKGGNVNTYEAEFIATDTETEVLFLPSHADRISIFVDNPDGDTFDIAAFNGPDGASTPVGRLVNVETGVTADYHNVFLGPITMAKITRTSGSGANLVVTLCAKVN